MRIIWDALGTVRRRQTDLVPALLELTVQERDRHRVPGHRSHGSGVEGRDGSDVCGWSRLRRQFKGSS